MISMISMISIISMIFIDFYYVPTNQTSKTKLDFWANSSQYEKVCFSVPNYLQCPKLLWDHHFYLLIAFGAYPSSLIIFCTINIRTVIKCTILFSNWSSPSLVHEMPVKAREWSVLCTFVL